MKVHVSSIILLVVVSMFIGSTMKKHGRDSSRNSQQFPVKVSPSENQERPVSRRINIRTRLTEKFAQIGTLYNGGMVLPLYGRRSHTSSLKWNYYTITNDHIHIQVPLEINNVDCMGQNGCKEIYEDETVYLPEYGTTFTVKLYDRSPRYIPHII
jgi:hypothetical protein